MTVLLAVAALLLLPAITVFAGRLIGLIPTRKDPS